MKRSASPLSRAQSPDKSQAQLDYEEGRGYVERGEAALAAVSLHNALRGFEQENNQEGMPMPPINWVMPAC